MKAFAAIALCSYAYMVAPAFAGDLHGGLHGGFHGGLHGGVGAPLAFKGGVVHGGFHLGPVAVKGAQEHFVLGTEFFPAPLPVHHAPAISHKVIAAPIAPVGGPLGGGVGLTHASLNLGGAHAVAGPSYLVSTVHHVQKVSHGGKYLGHVGPVHHGPAVAPLIKSGPHGLGGVAFPAKVVHAKSAGPVHVAHHPW